MSQQNSSDNIAVLPEDRPLPPPDQKRPSLWPLVALAIVAADTLGLYAYLSARMYLLNPVWIYLTLYAVLFCFYAYACGRVVPKLDPRHVRGAYIFIVVAGIAFRLVALRSDVSLSTDIFRYVWDGRLTVHHINPYRWAPTAESLTFLRDPLWGVMDYKAYQTIYMPVSQYIFAICNFLFHNHLVGYKLVFTLFDTGVVLLLGSLLRGSGRNGLDVIWYAWCPLPITEVAMSGHQDVTGVFFLMLTFVLIRNPKMVRWAAITLVCATLTKGFALMLFPLFIRNYGKQFAITAAIAFLYLGLPMFVYLPQFLHGMTQYLDNVHVNSSIFDWTNRALEHVTPYHFQVVSKLTDAVILAAAGWAAWRPAVDFADLARRSFIVLAVILMVVPTLFPWYLLWVLPFLPLIGRRPSWSFVMLACTVGLLYTYYISIKPFWWAPIVEYVPFYLILAWDYAYWRLGREPFAVLRERAATRALTPVPSPSTVVPSWESYERVESNEPTPPQHIPND